MESSLQGLLADVVEARRRQLVERGTQRRTPGAQHPADVRTLRALEAYAAALEAQGWPVPRLIQGEMQLLRSLIRG